MTKEEQDKIVAQIMNQLKQSETKDVPLKEHEGLPNNTEAHRPVNFDVDREIAESAANLADSEDISKVVKQAIEEALQSGITKFKAEPVKPKEDKRMEATKEKVSALEAFGLEDK